MPRRPIEVGGSQPLLDIASFTPDGGPVDAIACRKARSSS
jgi:hypothetical protein